MPNLISVWILCCKLPQMDLYPRLFPCPLWIPTLAEWIWSAVVRTATPSRIREEVAAVVRRHLDLLRPEELQNRRSTTSTTVSASLWDLLLVLPHLPPPLQYPPQSWVSLLERGHSPWCSPSRRKYRHKCSALPSNLHLVLPVSWDVVCRQWRGFAVLTFVIFQKILNWNRLLCSSLPTFGFLSQFYKASFTPEKKTGEYKGRIETIFSNYKMILLRFIHMWTKRMYGENGEEEENGTEFIVLLYDILQKVEHI